MITRRWTYLLVALMVPVAVSAQGPRGGSFPWWDSPLVSGLDLSDAQRTEIRSVIGEYRGRMLEVRGAVQKAESELDQIFNEETVDQRRGSEAIQRLTKARADMTQSVSEMSLRMRAVLTAQQWQELQRRQREQGSRLENAGRGPGPPRGPGRGRRLAKGGSKDGSKDSAPRTADNQPQPPPPALNQ
ncbi:MAG: Spy/CpxP family protein refolding chaperone [Acidobacteriia bacterium]|nr:Spy/CpxP family protein refolding chaperone [Terriglobia bacterium]